MIVASFYAPRPHMAQWQDYQPFLIMLERSCQRYGYKHVVLTDECLDIASSQFKCKLSSNLMFAVMEAQYELLSSPMAEMDDILLVGADCVIGQSITFPLGDADLGVTVRENAPRGFSNLNTGAIYVARNASVGLIWHKAMAAMRPGFAKWGDDQKALERALAPIIYDDGDRWHIRPSGKFLGDTRVRFLPMSPWNYSPSSVHDDTPAAVLHFKGARKAFMVDYCRDVLKL